jgi:hypothetical protein
MTGVGGSSSRNRTLQQALATRLAGVHIAAVAIGNWLDVYEMDNVVSRPYQSNVVAVRRFEQLTNNTAAQKQVHDIICGSELTDFVVQRL